LIRAGHTEVVDADLRQERDQAARGVEQDTRRPDPVCVQDYSDTSLHQGHDRGLTRQDSQA
jgi:hypothetical protein